MPTRLAILGLDPLQRDWLAALRTLRDRGGIELVAAAHRTVALARDLAVALDLPHAAVYDDLRKLLLETQPQVILMDRPDHVRIDFLTACLADGIGLFSLGPPVLNLAEARTLAKTLEDRTASLYIWPRFSATRAYRHCAQADEFVRPVRFATAAWYAFNHVLAKSSGRGEDPVRSLSVLAWDALATLTELVGGGVPPESVYAAIRGAGGKPDNFADLSRAAALTLRFAEGCAVSVTLSDQIGPWQRQILLLGQSGTLRLDEESYAFCDREGKLIDEGRPIVATGEERAIEELTEFLEHFAAPPSPHRGWEHRLVPVAATLEAMVVSHRTGQPEAPDRLMNLRR